jgi:hypothetical protein
MKPRLNAEWHRLHRMPANPTMDQRIVWHREHAKHCACRPVPKPVLDEIARRARGRARRG